MPPDGTLVAIVDAGIAAPEGPQIPRQSQSELVREMERAEREGRGGVLGADPGPPSASPVYNTLKKGVDAVRGAVDLSALEQITRDQIAGLEQRSVSASRGPDLVRSAQDARLAAESDGSAVASAAQAQAISTVQSRIQADVAARQASAVYRGGGGVGVGSAQGVNLGCKPLPPSPSGNPQPCMAPDSVVARPPAAPPPTPQPPLQAWPTARSTGVCKECAGP